MKRTIKKNPPYKPPAIGPAEVGARERMAELYSAIRTAQDKKHTSGPNKGLTFGEVYFGDRAPEVAARTAWKAFKREYEKRGGKWVKKTKSKRGRPKKKRGRASNPGAEDVLRSAGRVAGKALDEQIDKGKKLYEDFKWGIKSDRSKKVKVPAVPPVMVHLGTLHAVEYETTKAGDGRNVYRHSFKTPRPVLATDPQGKYLFIVGGGYKVKPEGIIN